MNLKYKFSIPIDTSPKVIDKKKCEEKEEVEDAWSRWVLVSFKYFWALSERERLMRTKINKNILSIWQEFLSTAIYKD